MNASLTSFLLSVLGAASLLLPAVAHADPPAPAPKANKVAPAPAAPAAKDKAATPAAAPVRALRRIEKKEALAKAAGAAGTAQTREVTIEARSQGPSMVFHIEKAPVHFDMHDLGGPYPRDPAAPVTGEATSPAKPAAPAPAAPPAAKVEKKLRAGSV